MKILITLFILVVSAQGFAKALSPREKVKLLFESTNTSASLNDFSFRKIPDPNIGCIIYPPRQEKIYSYPVWFFKEELELAPDGPLFPGGEKKIIIISNFTEGSINWSSKPGVHSMEQSRVSLNVKYWGDVRLEGEKYEAWAWLRYEFKKNGELLVFKMSLNDSLENSYGYCWKKNPHSNNSK